MVTMLLKTLTGIGKIFDMNMDKVSVGVTHEINPGYILDDGVKTVKINFVAVTDEVPGLNDGYPTRGTIQIKGPFDDETTVDLLTTLVKANLL
jgi:hypothetical protein